MKVICAWGGEDMGEKEPLADTRISHSCCQACKDRVLAGLAKTRPEAVGATK